MEASAVDVSVLVPVRNEEEHIRTAVDAMLAQRFPGTIEFLFIDGESEDGTRAILEEIAQKDPRVRLLDNPARKTPQALNIGLRAARGHYVARMDAHTRYPPDYLAQGVERLKRGDVIHVSGPALAHGVDTWSRRVALALAGPVGTGGADFRRTQEDEFEVESGFTGVWLKSTLDEVGGWDEGWPQNQDAELAARLRARGGRMVCLPSMAAEYVPRNSLESLARQYWRYGKYRARTSGRHPDSMRPAHLVPPAIAVTAVTALVPGRLGRLARGGMAAYALALGVGAARTASREKADWRDAAWLPVVFACMHISWGFGFIAGSVEFGPPFEAARRALRRLRR